MHEGVTAYPVVLHVCWWYEMVVSNVSGLVMHQGRDILYGCQADLLGSELWFWCACVTKDVE